MMAEAAAAGILPHVLLDYTYRMLYAALRGAVLRETRNRKSALFMAWQTANFTRAKRLPPLGPLLQKLDSKPAFMSAKGIRATIFGMAHAMGVKVTYKKRSP